MKELEVNVLLENKKCFYLDSNLPNLLKSFFINYLIDNNFDITSFLLSDSLKDFIWEDELYNLNIIIKSFPLNSNLDNPETLDIIEIVNITKI